MTNKSNIAISLNTDTYEHLSVFSTQLWPRHLADKLLFDTEWVDQMSVGKMIFDEKAWHREFVRKDWVVERKEKKEVIKIKIASRDKSYETFYGRNLRAFIIW
jgi:hypothetical protein